jgi:hypothetical protein
MTTEKVSITIEFDPASLRTYQDSHLATLWHLAQANPAAHGDRTAGEVAESVAREIVRRWLRATEPELWKHQGRDHYWSELRRHGKWIDGKYTPTPAGDEPAERST